MAQGNAADKQRCVAYSVRLWRARAELRTPEFQIVDRCDGEDRTGDWDAACDWDEEAEAMTR